MSEDQSVEARLAALAAKREEKAAARKQADALREVTDLEAIEELNLEGDHGRLKVAYTQADLPVVLVVRRPTRLEMKRHRKMCREGQKGAQPNFDSIDKAIEVLAATCLVYPDAKVYERLLDVSPGVAGRVAEVAIQLSDGYEAAEGKG